jgi:hypothetical protein
MSEGILLISIMYFVPIGHLLLAMQQHSPTCHNVPYKLSTFLGDNCQYGYQILLLLLSPSTVPSSWGVFSTNFPILEVNLIIIFHTWHRYFVIELFANESSLNSSLMKHIHILTYVSKFWGNENKWSKLHLVRLC